MGNNAGGLVDSKINAKLKKIMEQRNIHNDTPVKDFDDDFSEIISLIKDRYNTGNYTHMGDDELTKIYDDFRSLYGKNALSKLNGKQLLYRVFGTKSQDNLSLTYVVERNYMDFGSCRGAYGWANVLTCFQGTQWQFCTSASDINDITETVAIEKAESLVSNLVSGLDLIEEYINKGKLDSIQGYEELDVELKEVLGDLYNKPRFKKHLAMLYPNIFMNMYDSAIKKDGWLHRVFSILNLSLNGNWYIQSGRFSLLAKSIGIPNLDLYLIVKSFIEETGEIEGDILNDDEDIVEFIYEEIPMVPKQIIYYGAPGTGKSFEVDKQLIEKYPDEEARDFHTARVVFHPDYTYSDFVGSIRPVKPEGKSLTYEFVAGPFSELLKKCFLHAKEEFYLVLEEINRGNAAAIFGDLFQLLDRDDEIGKSSYRINNTDIAGYLKKDKRLASLFANDKVWLPSNFNIVCTMNTADQNVFVLDSAFKRRFSEEYTEIDFSKLTNELKETTSVFNGTTNLQQLFANTNLNNFIDKLAESGELNRDWPTFAKIVNYIIDVINEESGSEQISEDKKLGPFFVSVKDLENRKNFINKVLHYLKQDVFKYVDFYFTESYQTIHSKYIKETADIFNLLKRQGE